MKIDKLPMAKSEKIIYTEITVRTFPAVKYVKTVPGEE